MYVYIVCTYTQDGESEEPQVMKRFRSSLSPSPDVERVPRLDREFRRPPPPHQHKRRKPSRGHLQHVTIEMVPVQSGEGKSGEGNSDSHVEISVLAGKLYNCHLRVCVCVCVCVCICVRACHSVCECVCV